MSQSDTTAAGHLPGRLVALLAVTAGLAIANLYYVQPLLDLVAHGWGLTCAVGAVIAAGAVSIPLLTRRPGGC